MGNFLSKGLKKLSGNIKRHGGKILGAGLGIAGLMGAGPLSGLLGGVGSGIGKFIGGLGGGGGAAGGGWYPGKFLGQMFGGGQGAQSIPGMPDYLLPGGDPSGGGGNWFSKFKQGIGGTPGLLGLGLNIGGQLAKPNLSAGQLNTNMAPLQHLYDQFGEMSKQYQDPNSAVNKRIQDTIRSGNVSDIRNMINKNTRRSVGISDYGDSAITSSMMTTGIADALNKHSEGMAGQFDKGIGVMQNQASVANPLAQGLNTNMMYANQQAQQPYDFMSATGMGLLNRAMYQPQQYPGIDIG